MENIIASTDCGFAQVTYFARVHPQIMWAKLASLVEGAARQQAPLAAQHRQPAAKRKAATRPATGRAKRRAAR